MQRRITLLMFLFLFKSCLSSEPVKLELPPMDSTKASIMVSVTGEQKVYIGNKEISSFILDSILREKIDSFREKKYYPTVVISADSVANYGIVYSVMKSAKKAGAKVVVRNE